jgi:hypothetical protein
MGRSRQNGIDYKDSSTIMRRVFLPDGFGIKDSVIKLNNFLDYL